MSGVAAVDRALSILAAFDEHDQALSLAELAQRTGLYKSTILRLCASLERHAYLRRLSDGKYRLGPALLRLGQMYQQSFRLEAYVTPILEQLANETGESASLYVREGDKRVCLFRVNSTMHRVLHYVQVGTELPLSTGASGQVLRAFTEQGETLASVRQELLVVSTANRLSDTAAIACPVFGPGGALVGALSLAGPTTRFTDTTLSGMCATLLGAAARLSRQLGGEGGVLETRRALLEADTVSSDR